MAISNQTPAPRRPTPQIDPQFIWPTPEKQDLLFWVEANGTLPKNQGWAYGDKYQNGVEYPDHRLVHVTAADADGWSRWYYASNRISEDDYNFEFTQANIGGQVFHGVQRTYLTPRAEFSITSPAAGAAMPLDPKVGDPPAYMFSSGFVMSSRRQQRSGDDIFDSVYVVEIREYVKKVTITTIGVDDLNGGALSSTDTLYYATEVVPGTGLTAAALFAAPDNAFWGVRANGTKNTGKQLSAEWYEITNEDLVSGTFVGGGSSGVVNIGTFTTNEDYFWPPVLSQFEFMDWVRNDGGVDIFPRYTFKPDGYRGPCPTTIDRKWNKDPHTIPDVVPMLPTPITYASPFFRLAIPACLHGEVYAQCDIGTEDEDYAQNVGSTRTTPRTNYMAWPTTIVGDDFQQPYKGGYLRITKTYSQPDNSDQ